MTSTFEAPRGSERRAPALAMMPMTRAATSAPRTVLVIEDEEIVRESLGLVLEQAGYEVSFAENGRDALDGLYAQSLPDIIVLDLRMPVMDGWEFRAIQKDDPDLGLIPIVAVSADGTAQAAAISAQAYLRKPVDAKLLLRTIERLLADKDQQASVRQTETERLAALGRLAAAVGHEINNPLSFVMLNLAQSLDALRALVRPGAATAATAPGEREGENLRSCLAGVTDMLEDCQVGGERIRHTVSNLQRLSRQSEEPRGPIDVHQVIEQSVSMVWNQIRHRARLIKVYGKLPPVRGSGPELGQVFLNLLVNAVQSMPEGAADRNEVRITTSLDSGDPGREVVVEIRDTGSGIAPGILSRIFEPLFTTKPIGQGTGLGLSICLHTVSDHGGRMAVESEVGKGTAFRVFLPAIDSPRPARRDAPSAKLATQTRGRILVIDDEPLMGRIIKTALQDEHEVLAVQRAAQAIAALERGDTFDLLLLSLIHI